jgi:hypothetical protein
MSDRHDDDALLRSVAAHYAPPPMTASQRTRFDARLEERVQRGVANMRPWLAGVAIAAAVAGLLLWQTSSVAPTGDTMVRVAVAEPTLDGAATPEEWILSMAGDEIADANAGLPADYVAISSLLLGE